MVLDEAHDTLSLLSRVFLCRLVLPCAVLFLVTKEDADNDKTAQRRMQFKIKLWLNKGREAGLLNQVTLTLALTPTLTLTLTLTYHLVVPCLCLILRISLEKNDGEKDIERENTIEDKATQDKTSSYLSALSVCLSPPLPRCVSVCRILSNCPRSFVKTPPNFLPFSVNLFCLA